MPSVTGSRQTVVRVLPFRFDTPASLRVRTNRDFIRRADPFCPSVLAQGAGKATTRRVLAVLYVGRWSHGQGKRWFQRSLFVHEGASRFSPARAGKDIKA